MATTSYTFSAYRGEDHLYGTPNGSTTYCSTMMALGFEGAGATAITTGTVPGTRSVSNYNIAGSIAVSGTWNLSTAQFNLGTSSLAVNTSSSSYIRTNSNSSIYLGQSTLSFWVYLTSLPGAEAKIAHMSNSSTATDGASYFKLSIKSGGTLRAQSTDGVQATDFTTTAALTTGSWHWVTVVWDLQEVHVGINGTVQSFVNTVASPTLTASLWAAIVGGLPAGSYVDDFRWDDKCDPRYTKNHTSPAVAFESQTSLDDRIVATSSNTAVDYGPFDKNALPSDLDGVGVFADVEYDAGLVSSIARSPFMKSLLGTVTTPGGGGSTRPTTGFLYPRGQG